MLDFKVIGRAEGMDITSDIARMSPYTHVVSFADAHRAPLIGRDSDSFEHDDQHPVRGPFIAARGRQNVLCFEFDDIDSPQPGFREPKRPDVQRIIDFSRALPAHACVLFQCEMGRCRSAAAALICWVTIYGPDSPAQARVELLRRRPRAEPNNLMLDHAEDILKVRFRRF